MTEDGPQEDRPTDPLDVDSDRFLETGGAGRLRIGREAGRSIVDLEPGIRLGPYRVEELIGRGGMAGVYRAQRADGQFEVINLGLVHIGFDNEKAKEHFLAAERVVLKVGTPDDTMLAYIYGNLTPIYITDGDIDKSLEYADKSLRISRIHFSETPARVATAISWKGRVLREMGKLPEAALHFQQAIDMTLEQYGKEDVNASDYLYWLSQTRLDQGQCGAARAARRDDFRENLVPWLIPGETLDAYEAALAACE